MIKKILIKTLLIMAFITLSLSLISCGDSSLNDESGDNHTHSYTQTTIEATCKEKGYIKYTCSCGDTYNDNYVEAFGCDNVLLERVEPTCTTTGLTEGKTACTHCGEGAVAQNTIDALNHSFINYTYNNNATCTENGTQTAKCERCEEYNTIEKENTALNHSFINYTYNNNATCTENGTQTAKCERCEEYNTIEKDNTALNHSFINYTYDNNATCTENGTQTAKCERCEEYNTIEKENSKLSHNFNQKVISEDFIKDNASCTKKAEYYYSCECGEEGDAFFEHGELLEHVFSTKYSYDESHHWFKCLNCKETTEKISHNYINYLCVCGNDVTPVVSNTYTRVDINSNEDEEGNYVLFGSYPQSLVTDSAIINALGSYSQNTWNSYNYFKDEVYSDIMLYTDKEYQGEKYRGVYLNEYRNINCSNDGGDFKTHQKDYGYNTKTIYWFKYEPIKWRILNVQNSQALILCESIIDSQQFDFEPSDGYHYSTYSNRYAESTIRKWLNGIFYQTAFTNIQQEIILTKTVVNNARSTNPYNKSNQWNNGKNPNTSQNKDDKVFFLSVEESTNPNYGFNVDIYSQDKLRQKQTSDYAKAQGCYEGFWMLRSPFSSVNYSMFGFEGLGEQSGNDVYRADSGVVPAVWIHLHTFNKQVISDEYLKKTETCTESGIYYYSCSCGEKSNKTFDYDNLKQHNFTDGACDMCGLKVSDLISLATYNLDLSKNKDGSIMGYLIPIENDCYEYYVFGEGELPAKSINTATEDDLSLYILGYTTKIKRVYVDEKISNLDSFIYLYCTLIEEVTIPENVTKIGEGVFFSCTNLVTIEIPKSVKHISNYAFMGCSNLKNIKFNGTKEEWNSIYKDVYWNYETGRYTIYCIDGTISKA